MTENEIKEYKATSDGGSEGVIKQNGKLYRFSFRRIRKGKKKREKKRYR